MPLKAFNNPSCIKIEAIWLDIYTVLVLFFCLLTSSSLCRKDQFAVSYFSMNLKASRITLYTWPTCGLNLACVLEVLSNPDPSPVQVPLTFIVEKNPLNY